MPSYRNTTTGVIDANGESVTLAYRETVNGGFGIQASGTFSGTLQFQMTIDGTNFVPVEATDVGDSSTLSTTTTSAGIWKFDAVGALIVRVTSTAWTSGSATVTIVGLGG